MQELQLVIWPVEPEILDQELKVALPGKVLGLSTYGPGREISVLLDDRATTADEATATEVAELHRQRAASGYYRLLPAFQAQSQAFITMYRARLAQRTTTFKRRMRAIQ